MATQHIILLAINIIGVIAVIVSYIFGINVQAGGANFLWAGVPESIRRYMASLWFCPPWVTLPLFTTFSSGSPRLK